MSQQKSKKTLINWDLVSVNPNDKSWEWKDLFYFWGVSLQSIIGFSLIVSLYLIYNLNTFVVFFGTILGSFLVYLFSNFIGKPSQKFGLPFAVLLRSSLGFKGAKYAKAALDLKNRKGKYGTALKDSGIITNRGKIKKNRTKKHIAQNV